MHKIFIHKTSSTEILAENFGLMKAVSQNLIEVSLFR